MPELDRLVRWAPAVRGIIPTGTTPRTVWAGLGGGFDESDVLGSQDGSLETGQARSTYTIRHADDAPMPGDAFDDRAVGDFEARFTVDSVRPVGGRNRFLEIEVVVEGTRSRT